MTTREQLSLAAVYALFLTGLVLVVVGAESPDLPYLTESGVALGLGMLPLVILARVRRAVRISDDDAEALRREGYRLGLDHAARGLLTPPPAHHDGPGALNALGATIHHLHSVPRRPAAGDVERGQCAR